MSEKPTIQFEIYDGDRLLRTEVLAESTIKIGKLSSSHVRIDDDDVSRMHAVIEASSPDDVVVLDLGSTSGTFVNGQRVTKQRLRRRDGFRPDSGRSAAEHGRDGDGAVSAGRAGGAAPSGRA
jgi:pSer/pThr/pTyr-binding forkhead associated (FHA) protein